MGTRTFQREAFGPSQAAAMVQQEIENGSTFITWFPTIHNEFLLIFRAAKPDATEPDATEPDATEPDENGIGPTIKAGYTPERDVVLNSQGDFSGTIRPSNRRD